MLMTRPPRILHFCTGFSKLSETFIYDQVVELARQGWDTHVAAPQRENASERPFANFHLTRRPSRYNPLDLMMRAFGRGSAGGPARLASPLLLSRIRRVIERVEPDLIHAHFGNAGALISPAAAAMSRPLIVSFYGFDVSRLPREADWNARYSAIWQQAACVIALSKDMARKLQALGCPSKKLAIVHLSRAGTPGPCPQRRGIIRKWISVGRLVEKKGHDDAIRAIHKLRDRFPDVSLEIIGDGPYRQTLERLIRELHLGDVVHLAGPLPNQQVMAAMKRADAFVLCSKVGKDGDEEGTPTVLVEAQLLGLPTVATLHAGIPEMIPDSNHRFLAPEGSVHAIADRMQLMMSQTASEIDTLVAAGLHHASSHFNLTAECEKLANLYKHLLQPNA